MARLCFLISHLFSPSALRVSWLSPSSFSLLIYQLPRLIPSQLSPPIPDFEAPHLPKESQGQAGVCIWTKAGGSVYPREDSCCVFICVYFNKLIFIYLFGYTEYHQGGSYSFVFLLSFFFWPSCADCGILVPQPRTEPTLPVLEVQSLNHWTAWEIQLLYLF